MTSATAMCLHLAGMCLHLTLCASSGASTAAGGFQLPSGPNTDKLLRKMVDMAPPLSNYAHIFGGEGPSAWTPPSQQGAQFAEFGPEEVRQVLDAKVCAHVCGCVFMCFVQVLTAHLNTNSLTHTGTVTCFAYFSDVHAVVSLSLVPTASWVPMRKELNRERRRSGTAKR